MPKQSWALLSGSSTGIGRATVQRLASVGFHVVAGVRSAADGEAVASGFNGKVFPVMLDVTSQSSIDSAVSRAKELSGDSGLHALINNAGIVVPGPVETVSAADWRHQFDVNFFGMVELTRAALPLLRAGATSLGAGVPRLLFVSSIGGRVAQPMLAPYTCSKFATSALGDSLRLELRRQGIGVTVIEPGAIATPIWAKGDAAAQQFGPDHPARQLYGQEIDGLIGVAKKAAARAITAEYAAEVLVKSIQATRAPARVLIGSDAKITSLLRNFLPLSWFDSILMRQFGMVSR